MFSASSSYRYMLEEHPAKTKRPPAVSSGKRGAPAVYLQEVFYTELQPVTDELARRFMLESPMEVTFTTVHGDLDIIEGDIFVVDATVEYSVVGVADWKFRKELFKEILLEIVKD